MNDNQGRLLFTTGIDNSKLSADARQAKNQLTQIGNHAIQQSQRMDNQFGRVGSTISSAFKSGVNDAKSALADLGKNIVGISALMASGTFIKDIYSSVGEFNKQMRIVSTISEDVADNMDSYKQRVLDMCASLSIAPETAAAALYQINSAGHLGADGMKVLESSAKAAIGGVTDTATAADAITTILNAYHMSADQAEAVSDKLFTTVRLGKTTMDELGRSIATVAPMAATYKISIDEVLAAVAQLTKQGNSTQNAMTQVSASIIAVANEMGDDAFKNGLLPALEEIEKWSNGSNLALKQQLSNIRAVRAALGLTKENAAETALMINEIKNSAGAADEACGKMNTTASAELTKLKNNFIQEFSSMATEGTNLMGSMAKSLNEAFEIGAMEDFLDILGLIIAEVGIYKAVVIAASTLENAEKTALLNAEYKAWLALTPAKEASASADVEAAVAAGRLTEAKAAEIIAMREELAAKIDSAKASLTALKAEESEAAIAVATAQAKRTAAVEAMAAKEAELVASGEICGAYISETAATELDTAAKNINTATTERNAAAKQLAAVQTELNTKTTELNTLVHQQSVIAQEREAVSTQNLSLAKRILTAAQTKLTAVTTKLYATMTAHPYALIAAAVAAVCYAVYKWITYQTDAEKAQAKLNETTAKFAAEAMTEQRELDALFKTLRTVGEESNAYAAAKQHIIDKYGSYLDGLIDEKGKITDLEAAYVKLTKAIKDSANARALDEATKDAGEKLSETQKKKINEIVKTLGKEHNDTQLTKELQDSVLNLIRKNFDATGFLSSETERYIGSLFGEKRGKHGWAGDSIIIEINSSLKGMRDAQRLYDSTIEDANNKFGAKDNPFEGWTKAQLQSAETQLEDLIKAGDVTDLILYNEGKEVAKYKNLAEARAALIDIQQALKAPEDATTTTTGKKKPLSDEEKKAQEKATKKANHTAVEIAERNEAIEAAKNAEIKATRDAELERRQAELELREESTQKSLDQIAIDKERMLNAIEDREQELLEKYRDIKKQEWENENPDAKDKGLRFDRTSISMEDMKAVASEAGNEWLADALATINKSKEVVKQTAEHSLDQLFDGWIEQFGNYYQRREQLTNQWENILQGLPAQYMEEAVKAMNEQLGALQMDKIKEDLNWDDVFGNLQNMSSQALDTMISKLRAYKGVVDETYDPKVIKEYDAAMRKLESAKKATDKGLWSVFVPQAFKDRMEAEEELAEMQKRHAELLDKQEEKEAEVAKKVNEIVAKLKEVTGEEISVDIVQDPAKLQKKINQIKVDNPIEGANLQNLAGDLGQTQGELSGITKAAGEAGQAIQGMQGAGGGVMATMAQVGAIVQKVNESVQSASKLVHNLSDTSEALGADTSVGSGWDTATTIMDGFAEASEGATQAFQSLMSGNPIGVIQGIVQSFTGWIKAFAKIHDSKNERAIQQMQEQIDDLQTSYDLLGHEIDKAFGKDASNLIDQQTQMLEQQKQLIQMQIAEEESKKNSDEDKIKEWRNQLKQLNNDIEDSKAAAVDAIFGEDIKSAIENFADALADAWTEGTDASKGARDVVRKMMQQMVAESIKAAIQSSGQMEKIRAKLQEFYSDNVLQPWEQDQIYEMADQLQKELDTQYGWSKSLFANDEEEAERSAATKGIAQASQDSVDELNGRATAIQGHTFSIAENTKILLSNTQAILRSVMNIESETNGLGARLGRIEGNIKTMTTTLDDIATRGIRMKQ